MASVRISIETAKLALDGAWSRLDDESITVPPEAEERVREVLESRAVTYKYILITGLLAKLTNPNAHPRALQAGSSLPGAYDARSLCHKVIVPFEKDRGTNLFGLSNEPFVNKTARHPELSKDNSQLRDKRLAKVTHELLDLANEAEGDEVEALLVVALRVSRDGSEARHVAMVDVETNLRRVVRFCREFLAKTNGGTRLVAVVGAFISMLGERYKVRVYPPTQADMFAKTAGDIEVFLGKKRLSAYKCKQRPLTLADVRHGIKKARESAVGEYCFVIGAGVARGQERSVLAEIKDAQAEFDVSLIDIQMAIPTFAAALNPDRRSRFGEVVTATLRDDMKRPAIADDAAALWNSLE